MKYILDTHTFIWWHNNTHHLSNTVLAICEDMNNELLLSMVSIWEMQIKLKENKLKLNTALIDIISLQQANGINILPIKLNHLIYLESINTPCNDLFDNLLMAQAMVENAIILTKDTKFKEYAVQTLW